MTPGVPPVLTPAAETIIGTSRADVITGVGSGDVVLSGAGDDRISISDPTESEYDNVYVDSGTNNDLVVLSPNGKRVNFSTFVLGAGNDSASGGGWNLRNTFYGGPGNDFVLDGSESGTRAIYMGGGNDRVLHGGSEVRVGIVDLGAGDDVYETAVSGEIVGGPGDDRFEVGGSQGGLDLHAGTGNDYLNLHPDACCNTADMGAGQDHVDLGGYAGTIYLGPGQDTLTAAPINPSTFGNLVDGGTNTRHSHFPRSGQGAQRLCSRGGADQATLCY